MEGKEGDGKGGAGKKKRKGRTFAPDSTLRSAHDNCNIFFAKTSFCLACVLPLEGCAVF